MNADNSPPGPNRPVGGGCFPGPLDGPVLSPGHAGHHPVSSKTQGPWIRETPARSAPENLLKRVGVARQVGDGVVRIFGACLRRS